MFKQMRRINQLMSNEKARVLLNSCTHGVLGTINENGYPYTIPLSYALVGDSIFFHCAKTGEKLDAIKQNPKVSFCAVATDIIVPEKFTTHYESVVAFGQAKIVTDEATVRKALKALVDKYSAGFEQEGDMEIEKSLLGVCVVEIKIEHLTGKCAKELL